MGRPYYWTVRRAVKNSVRTISDRKLSEAWAHSELRNLQLYCLNSKFRALPRDVWEQVIAHNGVDRSRYRSEHFECNNFAMCLAGDVSQRWEVNGAGIVIDNCDDGDLDLVIVEPQTDELISRPRSGHDAR